MQAEHGVFHFLQQLFENLIGPFKWSQYTMPSVVHQIKKSEFFNVHMTEIFTHLSRRMFEYMKT